MGSRPPRQEDLGRGRVAIISSGEVQRADHRVGDDERERHDERCTCRRAERRQLDGTISSMAPSISVQLERVERARTSECVSDVVERRTTSIMPSETCKCKSAVRRQLDGAIRSMAPSRSSVWSASARACARRI